MAITDRKKREKEQFRALVIQAGYDLVKHGGIEGLTLRKLAASLDYSTTKLYHEFGEKLQIIILLAEDICQRQNVVLGSLKKSSSAEKHLLRVTHEASRFYANEPWSAEILKAVRFGIDPSEMPPAFITAAENYRSHVVALNLSALSTPEALDEALYLTRFLTLGGLSVLRPDSSEEEKDIVVKIIDKGMRVIIAGWKSQSQ